MVALPQALLRHSPAPLPRLQPRRVAVVLNRNARKVDDEALAWVRSVVPHEDLFVSVQLDDLGPICEMLIARCYDAVLWGGGDGTFVHGVNALLAAADARGRAMPDVGVMRLGTGNAVAETLGAAEATPDGLGLDLSLLTVDGRDTVFCGFGLDAQILDDFGKTVGMLKRVGLAQAVQSANARYFLAVTGRSIPRFVFSPRTEIVAINRGAPALRIDVDGHQVGEPIAAGRVLWRGLASLASAASIPYYGLGLKMFPHAQKRADRFQLRLSDVGTAEALTRLPEVWRGHYQGKHIHDFLVDKVELLSAKPAPFQSGGDLVGERSAVTIGISPRRVSVV
jgi:diacylglycerol kinase family enzyme